MRQAALYIAIGLVSFVASLPALAATQSVTGTVGGFYVQSSVVAGKPAGTIVFQLSVSPTATGCPAGPGFFEFSAASVADAQTRSNMTATLLAAKSSGLTVSVIYDDAGAYCDSQGYAVPIDVVLP